MLLKSTVIAVPFLSKVLLCFLQRSSADQSVILSKFETLGGELDEKRKLGLGNGYMHTPHFIIQQYLKALSIMLYMLCSRNYGEFKI